jgi:hypothetical protein
MMIDTVAILSSPSHILSETLFAGGAVTEHFDSGHVSARLWLNPSGDVYAPRVTYWRDVDRVADGGGVGIVKLEFSAPKLAGVAYTDNPSERDISRAWQAANEFITDNLPGSGLPMVQTWRVQRVDYTYQWKVGELLVAYMAALSRLRIKNWSRHPFDAAEGVVWKSRGAGGRWVKFYNKAREQGDMDSAASILRFEVSNYRQAVRYMAKAWYASEQTLLEMTVFSRALYVMGRMWDALGFGYNDDLGRDELLLLRMSQTFGKRVGTAMYALRLIQEYGSQAFAAPLGLISRSMYYRYRSELAEHGFLAVYEDEAREIVPDALPAVHLPTKQAFDAATRTLNLVTHTQQPQSNIENSAQIFASWKQLTAGLSLKISAVECRYLWRRYREYAKASDVGTGAEDGEPARRASGVVTSEADRVSLFSGHKRLDPGNRIVAKRVRRAAAGGILGFGRGAVAGSAPASEEVDL